MPGSSLATNLQPALVLCSFLFSPFILTWLLANGAIGLYNIFKHDASIFRALSPHYLYYFWAVRGLSWALLVPCSLDFKWLHCICNLAAPNLSALSVLYPLYFL